MIAKEIDTVLNEIAYIHFLIVGGKALILWKEFFALPGPDIKCNITYTFKYINTSTNSGKVIGIFFRKEINNTVRVRFFDIINQSWEYEYEIAEDNLNF